jgi:hypothetical protein
MCLVFCYATAVIPDAPASVADFGTVPPKVEYALSTEGRSLVPVLSVMHAWGVQHLLREEPCGETRRRRERARGQHRPGRPQARSHDGQMRDCN